MKIVNEYTRTILKEEITFANKMSLILYFMRVKVMFYRLRKRYKLKRTQKYNVLGAVTDLKLQIHEVFHLANRTNSMNKPFVLSKLNKPLTMLEGVSPDLHIYIINECMVFSRTSSLGDGDNIYNHVLYNLEPRYDFKHQLVQSIDSFVNKKVILYINNYIRYDSENIYIHLLNEHSQNYYHWLFELMPKFILICEHINNSEQLKNNKYILIVDEDLPKQFYEVLSAYSTINYEIKVAEKFQAILVKKIIYCTDFWLSIDNTKFTPNVKKEFFVDKYAVFLIKQRLKKKLSQKEPYRKLYLERSQKQARYILNSEEIKNILMKYGFEVIKAEELSFFEQVQIFNEAKVIVGGSGALFSNIIYMQKNTNALIFSPRTIAANYYVFQQMADVAEVNLIHLLTENSSYTESIHESAPLNVDNLEAALKGIL